MSKKNPKDKPVSLPGHPRPSSAAWASEAGSLAAASPGFLAEHGATIPVPPPGVVQCRPEAPCRLAEIDPDAPGSSDGKAAAESELLTVRARIQALQERLYAERKRSLLVVLQAIDTGGKDGTIRHVFEGVNPQGCRVSSFKTPSPEELDHDFLWRYHREVPARGMIGVFNRSHYEDVLIVRVKELVPETMWRPRYDLINDFERLLTLSGTTVLKIFLHISKAEQKERLESRLADPTKNWKFDPADLVERQAWDSYQAAFQDALTLCGTRLAPWHVVPANRKWFRNLAVAKLIAGTLEAMDPRYPKPKADLTGITVPD